MKRLSITLLFALVSFVLRGQSSLPATDKGDEQGLAAPFHRDPMAELSAACKKYEIRFGFYYSHAFDWEHPDAPGNDWDYDNPGGDKLLHGGTGWFNVHPELLPKAVKYVNEKSIKHSRQRIDETI